MPTRSADKSHGPVHPPVTAPDPLADLRDDPAVLDDLTPAAIAPGRAGDRQEADAATLVVEAWHRDVTATRTLHKGGGCACRYLAEAALEATDA